MTDKNYMLRFILVILFILSSFATDIGGEIGAIFKHLETYDIEVPEEILDKKDALKSIEKLPPELQFLKGHLAFSQYEVESFDEDVAKKRAQILYETLDPETFDFLFIGFQEICGFYMSDEEPEKCENLEEWFYGVNDEYQILLETGYVPGGKIEDLVGEDVLGYIDGSEYIDMELPDENEDGTVYEHDVRTLSDESINSFRLKNAALVKDQKNISKEESLYIICQFELFDKFEQEEKIMLGLADALEGELLRGDTSLEIQAQIDCTLEVYYKRIGNHDRWFLLIPRTPQGIDLNCEN